MVRVFMLAVKVALSTIHSLATVITTVLMMLVEAIAVPVARQL
jgi:hypothetical protein